MATTVVLTGCAIGGAGMIVGKVTAATGGWVLDTYTVGLHLRTGDNDEGIGLGMARRSYVFAGGMGSAPEPGWYPFIVPRARSGMSVLRYSETLGLDVRVVAPEPGVTFGYQRLLVGDVPEPHDDVFLEVRFVPSSPSLTCITTTPEVSC